MTTIYQYPLDGLYSDHKKALKRGIKGTGVRILRKMSGRRVEIDDGGLPRADVLALLYLFGTGEIA